VRGSLSGAYVRKSGDTMTGALTIATTAAQPLIINRSDASDGRHLVFQRGGITQAEIAILNAEPKLRIRDSGANERLTLRADTGLLGTGLIPLSMTRVDEETAQNAGAVTILAANTLVVSLASMDVNVGDIIHYVGFYRALKGATTGLTRAWVAQQAGTAVIAEALGLTGADLPINHITATTEFRRVSGMYRVTTAGTLTLILGGASAGSNSTVAINDGQLHALVLRGP
jgi:hypothetical protein